MISARSWVPETRDRAQNGGEGGLGGGLAAVAGGVAGVGSGRLAEGFAGGGDAPPADLPGPLVEPIVGVPLLDEDQLEFHVGSVPGGCDNNARAAVSHTE